MSGVQASASLPEASEVSPDAAERLARAGSWREALQVWRRIFAETAVTDGLCRRAVLLLSDWYGSVRPGRSLGVLRSLAAAIPASAKLWAQLAEQFEAEGRRDQAIVAWDLLREGGGNNINTQERRDRLWFARVKAARARSGPRILVIGNCQALGISQSIRRLCEGADVTGQLWATYQQPGGSERLFASLELYDLVVSQFFGKPSHAVRSEQLAARSRGFVHVPRVYFAGYHPDLLRRPNIEGQGRLPIRGWHSVIVAAAHRMGLPRRRVTNLFNAYVYGVLGYFEEFGKARRLQLLEGESVGFDLSVLLEQWIRSGPFVHVPDHPTAATLHSLAREVCNRAGVPVRADAEPGEDVQSERDVWPVYPEIARRLATTGSLTFRAHQPPDLDLTQIVDRYYAIYDDMGTPEHARVTDAVDVLRREGV